MRKGLLFVSAATAALLMTATPAHAQASLARAKELYAAANYDEALMMLNALGSSAWNEGSIPDAHAEDAATIAMYRVLCLIAVGRSGEVEAAINRLVSQHPLYRPPSDELSPRIRSAVTAARLKLLPSLAQQRYTESKAAYDRGDFAAAGIGFKWVLGLLADPDLSPVIAQPPLSDIRRLAAGFADMAEKALVPPPPSPPAAAAPLVAAAPVRDFTRVFSPEDSDVVAPVTIRQPMPRFPMAVAAPVAGLLELVIDRSGAVESARLLDAVHPQYDSVLLGAAKKWQYQPARLDGRAVRYLKRIQINLAPPK